MTTANNSFELPTITMDFNTLMSNPMAYVQQQQTDMARIAMHIARRKLLNEGGGRSVREIAEDVKELSKPSEAGIPHPLAHVNGIFINTWLDQHGYQMTTVRVGRNGSNNFFRHATETADRSAWCCVVTDTDSARSLAWHPEIALEIVKDLLPE